jgi:hypothetical protein
MIFITEVFCYFTVKEDTFNLMVGTHNKTLMIYQNVTLAWAAQLPHIPVDAKVANFAYVHFDCVEQFCV